MIIPKIRKNVIFVFFRTPEGEKGFDILLIFINERDIGKHIQKKKAASVFSFLFDNGFTIFDTVGRKLDFYADIRVYRHKSYNVFFGGSFICILYFTNRKNHLLGYICHILLTFCRLYELFIICSCFITEKQSDKFI